MKFELRDASEANRLSEFVKNRSCLDFEIVDVEGGQQLHIYDPTHTAIKLKYGDGEDQGAKV